MELRRIASLNEWEVVQEFVDEGISGAKGRDKRPQFDALLKASVRKEFDLIMSWSVDRLGRSLVFGLGVSAFLISASILVAVLVLAGEHSLGFFDAAIALGLAGSLLAAAGLVGGLLWNLFIRQRLRSLKFSRFAGLIPGFGKKDR